MVPPIRENRTTTYLTFTSSQNLNSPRCHNLMCRKIRPTLSLWMILNSSSRISTSVAMMSRGCWETFKASRPSLMRRTPMFGRQKYFRHIFSIHGHPFLFLSRIRFHFNFKVVQVVKSVVVEANRSFIQTILPHRVNRTSPNSSILHTLLCKMDFRISHKHSSLKASISVAWKGHKAQIRNQMQGRK